MWWEVLPQGRCAARAPRDGALPCVPARRDEELETESVGLRVALSSEAHAGMSDYVAATSLSRLTCFIPHALLSDMLHMKEPC